MLGTLSLPRTYFYKQFQFLVFQVSRKKKHFRDLSVDGKKYYWNVTEKYEVMSNGSKQGSVANPCENGNETLKVKATHVQDLRAPGGCGSQDIQTIGT